MKTYFYILIALLFAACQQKTDNSTSESQKKSEKETNVADSTSTESKEISEERTYDYYAGTIGLYGEDVLVEISKNENEITGRYWYLKHGKPIQIEGNSSAKGVEWQLTEKVKNVVTGNMTLEVTKDSLKGQWYAPGRASEVQRVSLKKVLVDQDKALQPNFETYTLSKTISIYSGLEDEEQEVEDELRLVKIGKYVLFQYFVIGTNAHTGHINGLATFNSKNKAVYRGEESCELALEFFNNEVTVTEEEDCSYYRGMRAYFGGTLSK